MSTQAREAQTANPDKLTGLEISAIIVAFLAVGLVIAIRYIEISKYN
jgi:hypothetical protein